MIEQKNLFKVTIFMLVPYDQKLSHGLMTHPTLSKNSKQSIQ